MIKLIFSRESKESSYRTLNDLSSTEKNGLNKLGQDLPALGSDRLAHTFGTYLELGWQGMHVMQAEGDTSTRFKLYHPIEDGGRERFPYIEFLYAPTQMSKDDDALIHVSFAPAYLTSASATAKGDYFALKIHKMPADDSQIKDPRAKAVFKYVQTRINLAPVTPQEPKL